MKVLVVDDDAGVRKHLTAYLQRRNGPDGQPYEAVGAESVPAALELLAKERYDAVVADMYMGTDPQEGLEVLKRLTGLSPVTIVLTAYGSFGNCVASMRAGAWDYIEKTDTDGDRPPYETLVKSLENGFRFRQEHPEAGRVNPDAVWFGEHFGELMAKHGGKVVAVLDGEVVGVDCSYSTLREQMAEKYPYASPMLVSLPGSEGVEV